MTEKNTEDNHIRVLQVLDKCAMRGAPIHGVSRLLLSWWPAFNETDVDLTLCVLRGETGCDAFTRSGVYVEDLNRGKMDPLTIFDLIKIIRRDRIQILHCHGYGATTFGRLAGLLTGRPVIVHEHMVDKRIPSYQKLVDKLLSRFTAKGVAVSKAVKVFMTGPRSIPEQRMQVIYNCVPAEYCEPLSAEQKQVVAKQYGIPEEKMIVGIVGRLDPVKGHADFLLAVKQVLKAVPETCFVIVGEGELRTELEKYAQQLGIQNDVLFLGHCENIKEIVSLFDLLASSSLSEGLPLNILEAMAQGKPVVATSVGGIPEVIEEGKNGFLVPVNSPDKLADKIIKLLCDDKLRHQLGVNALKHCQQSFLAPVSVSKLVKLYNELL